MESVCVTTNAPMTQNFLVSIVREQEEYPVATDVKALGKRL